MLVQFGTFYQFVVVAMIETHNKAVKLTPKSGATYRGRYADRKIFR